MKGDTNVGHVPQEPFRCFWHFIRRGDFVTCDLDVFGTLYCMEVLLPVKSQVRGSVAKDWNFPVYTVRSDIWRMKHSHCHTLFY